MKLILVLLYQKPPLVTTANTLYNELSNVPEITMTPAERPESTYGKSTKGVKEKLRVLQIPMHSTILDV